MESNPITQPRTIDHDGRHYVLMSKRVQVSENPPVSTGPFYKRDGTDPADWQFMPDARFLAGLSDSPSFMHCIQQRVSVLTPRPV